MLLFRSTCNHCCIVGQTRFGLSIERVDGEEAGRNRIAEADFCAEVTYKIVCGNFQGMLFAFKWVIFTFYMWKKRYTVPTGDNYSEVIVIFKMACVTAPVQKGDNCHTRPYRIIPQNQPDFVCFLICNRRRCFCKMFWGWTICYMPRIVLGCCTRRQDQKWRMDDREPAAGLYRPRNENYVYSKGMFGVGSPLWKDNPNHPPFVFRCSRSYSNRCYAFKTSKFLL